MKTSLNTTNFALVFLGITSLIAQVLLIRELITAFYGNELFLGLSLAVWLISTGLGSLLLVKLFKNIEKSLYWLYLIFPFLLVGVFVLVRIARVVLADPGVLPNLVIASLWTILTVAPVGLLLGVLFVLLVRLIKLKASEAVTLAYIIESLGFLVGALLFNFLLILLPALTALGVLAVISLLICLHFSFKISPSCSYLVSGLIVLTAIALGWVHLWDQSLLQWHFRGEEIIVSGNTKFSSLATTRVAEQLNFYANGRLADNSQNKFHNELLANPPLILGQDAKNVLLIGNGFTGILDETNKYPVSHIDYLELDQSYYESAAKLLDSQLPDNTRVIYKDARAYLADTNRKYDAVLINYSNPSTLAENRYFTQEFFRLLKFRLNPSGIVSLVIDTTPNYTVGAQNKLLASLYATLRSEFNYIKVLPDNEVLFLASPSEIKHDINIMEAKYARLGIKNQYLHSGYLYWRLKNDRAATLTKQLEESDAPLNSDFKPTLYYYQLQTFLEKMNINFKLISFAFLFFFLLLFFIFLLLRKPRITNSQPVLSGAEGLLISSMLPEFSLIAFEVLLILLFQTYHGILYTQLSLIIALILLGIALGSYYFQHLLNRTNLTGLTSLTIFSFSLITLIFLISLIVAKPLSFLFNFQLTFYCLSLVAGFAIGTKFPVINKLYLQNSTNLGAVYGADLIGGALGALLAGTVLLPLLGINLSLALFVLLSFISLVFISFLPKH